MNGIDVHLMASYVEKVVYLQGLLKSFTIVFRFSSHANAVNYNTV